MGLDKYCPICGINYVERRQTYQEHHCSKKVLNAIDGAHKAALRDERSSKYDSSENLANRRYYVRLNQGSKLTSAGGLE